MKFKICFEHGIYIPSPSICLNKLFLKFSTIEKVKTAVKLLESAKNPSACYTKVIHF